MNLTKYDKKLIHGICFHHIFLSENKAENMRPEAQDRAILLKYFPKHIAKLHFKFSDGHLNTRIKHLKLVKNLSYERDLPQNFWRIVVANKRKSVQYFKKQNNYFNQKYTKPNVQSLTMFPNTKKVALGQPYLEKFSLEGLHWMCRAPCYLNNLSNLKYLRLDILNKDIFQLLSRLKYSQRILSHLKDFKIHLSWPIGQNSELLQRFLTFKGILKHVTDLGMPFATDKDFFETLKLLPDSCPKLSSLFFCNFEESSQVRPEEEEGETTYLRSLKNFKNLQKIEIRIFRELNLLKTCVFPKSLGSLALDFSRIDWEGFIYNPSSLVTFETQPENLQNLETLDLYFADLPRWIGEKQFSHNHHLAIEIFLQDLLKKIPVCKELTLTLSYQYPFDYEYKASPFVFDLSRFLNSIEHLSQSLEVLNIKDKVRDYRLADFGAQSVVFPKLSRLSISTEIPPDRGFDDLINIVQVQGPNSSIKIEGIRVESCKALLSLFERFGEMKNTNVDKRVEMVVYAQNLHADEGYFEKNYEDVKRQIRRVKGLFLLIQLRRSSFRFIKELESFQPFFGDLQVHKVFFWE